MTESDDDEAQPTLEAFAQSDGQATEAVQATLGDFSRGDDRDDLHETIEDAVQRNAADIDQLQGLLETTLEEMDRLAAAVGADTAFEGGEQELEPATANEEYRSPNHTDVRGYY